MHTYKNNVYKTWKKKQYTVESIGKANARQPAIQRP